MTTDFQNYLSSKGYADHVMRDGLRGLVDRWESVAEGLAHANPGYVTFEEFLNDVDGRRILRECIELPYSRALGNGLFELRPRGRSGIGRAFYCFLIGQRVVVLHAFIKKSQQTPEAELKIARKRLKEVGNG